MKKVPNVPGIYYRLDKAGKKTYYLRLKAGGRQTWRAVGPRLQDAKDLWYAIKLGKAEDALGVKLAKKIPFRDLSTEYFKYYKNKARESNWARVQSAIKHLDGFFGRIQISKISLWTVENYVRYRRKWSPKIKPRTINYELSYLKAILNKAVAWNVLDKAPEISLIPVQDNRARVLSEKELEYALSHVTDTHRDAIMIALDTGLRINELFSLTPSSVNFGANVLHVDDTKSLKPRSIPMTPRVAQIIKRRFNKSGDRLFNLKNSKSLSDKFCYERKKLPEIPAWRFHDLRHTFITRLLRSGVDPYTVMKLSGHSQLKMVTRYLHTDDELKKAAIEKLVNVAPVTKEVPES